MKKHLLVLSLFLPLISQAAIYGTDDRQDIYAVPQYRETAKAVAVAVGHNLLLSNGDGTSRVDGVENYGDFVCAGERFAKQPSLGVCTGFLISDRLLVTAGHCGMPSGVVTDSYSPFCEAFDWYFGYALSADGKSNNQNIPADRLYRCKRVIRAETIEVDPTRPGNLPGNDFALIELDRPVSSDIKPLPIAKNPVKKGDLVFTIGFPLGMPAKFSGLSPVIKSELPIYFEVNLDTESGNSGGPVFNAQKEIVGILVSGHPIDLTLDPKLQCNHSNVCDDGGENCTEESIFPGQQKSNYVQRIETLQQYMPR